MTTHDQGQGGAEPGASPAVLPAVRADPEATTLRHPLDRPAPCEVESLVRIQGHGQRRHQRLEPVHIVADVSHRGAGADRTGSGELDVERKGQFRLVVLRKDAHRGRAGRQDAPPARRRDLPLRVSDRNAVDRDARHPEARRPVRPVAGSADPGGPAPAPGELGKHGDGHDRIHLAARIREDPGEDERLEGGAVQRPARRTPVHDDGKPALPDVQDQGDAVDFQHHPEIHGPGARRTAVRSQ